MLEYCLKTFLPPYDIFDLLIIIPILLLLLILYLFATNIFYSLRVSYFFFKNKTYDGIIKKYETLTPEHDTMLLPMDCASSTIYIPYSYDSPEKYYILLECHNESTQYIAKYEIPYDDYRKVRKGTNIKIEDNWKPVGFRILKKS